MSPWLSGSGSSSNSTSIPAPLPGGDPAVIVGMACRVPGASNPSDLWDLIEQQRDVQRKMPETRFSVDSFYHPDGKNKGTVLVHAILSLIIILTNFPDKCPICLLS
jgi:hypothetical protein